ncbi:centrosomal protein of 89 kDa-like isoform X2 [Ceratina calcarata]|uniref:Centrosomal protein of 89 kDa-like isoform X2 n=1 Tax=Ceratina calcarata TaxID=156304 RepID=A0AAJ7N4V0_9HYME|nr:centrosomal protein of 89 kDa-like isoform X2 [Ceratina calcarata]
MASFNNSTEQERRKHSCRKLANLRSSQETTCVPVYRRRRISRTKHTLKTHNLHKYPSDYVIDGINDYEDEMSSRARSKSHERERNRRLNEDGNHQKQILDEGINSLTTKEKRISKEKLKVANEYNKLEKRYKNIQEECEKLSNVLRQRESEYKTVCLHYEALVQMVQELEETKVNLVKQNQKLEAKKAQSTQDITLLKSVVYQLNTELERYQDKLREQKIDVSARLENSEEKYDARIWAGINFHALGPLLNAYQENLSEKRELVQMYEEEMADFGNRCKEILTENEIMHKEVQELKSECDRYAKDIKILIENTASLRKQNDAMKKEAIDVKREANDVRRSCELKVDIILKHNEALKKDLSATVTELSNLRGKYEVLDKEFGKMKSKEEQTVPASVHTTAIEECKTLLDDLKYQYENEKRNLCNHIKRIEESQPENEKQLIMVMAERNHLKDLTDNLERNLKHTQRKVEQMQSMVYSTRISRNSLKEQLSRVTAYCEELFSEYERIVGERENLLTVLRETEKENASMDRMGKSITSRVEALKNQLDTVRKGTKQEVDSVEKRMKLQELHVRRMKRDYQRKIQQLNDMIKEKENIIDRLQKEKHGSQNISDDRGLRSENNDESVQL